MNKRTLPIAALAGAIALLGASGPSIAGEAASAKFEQDRNAILAMSGEYEITFQFWETVALQEGYDLKNPYQEHALEIVEVVSDSGKEIVLQHLLWVAEGERVVKHWKQIWKYEDRVLNEFAGDNTWLRRDLSEAEAAGTWTQAVFQVDDSPRYESVGTWQHDGNLSSWIGSQTQRPLPRREYTTRDDYETMVCVNRHTITPAGWVHEQDNYKKSAKSQSVLCREAGLNVYKRVEGKDFSAVREYWKKTSAFWAEVSSRWDEVIAKSPTFRLREKAEGRLLYKQLFSLANKAGELEDQSGEIRKVIDLFVVDGDQ